MTNQRVTFSKNSKNLRAVCVWITLLAGGFFSGYAKADVIYDTKIVVSDDSVKGVLEQASQLIALQDKHPDLEAALRVRAQTDLARLKLVLNGKGYYDAALNFTINPKNKANSYLVTVNVDPGSLYHFNNVKIQLLDGSAPPDVGKISMKSLGLEEGSPALSAPVVAAQEKIQALYSSAGWPYAKITDRRVVIDSADKTMDITYSLIPGAAAIIGRTDIDGLIDLGRRYVERRIAWRQGDRYDQRQIDKTRQTLVATGLFSSVIVGPDGPVQPDGTVAIRMKLVERPPHTIGAGVSYDTSLGIGANVSWEDRNLFGAAEDLTVTAKGGSSDTGLIFKFVRPDAFWYRHDFVASVSAENELVDAFRSLSQQAQVGFQYAFDPSFTLGYSIKAEHARVDEKTDFRVYTLVGLPLFIRHDASDDLLNPTKGYRAGLEVTPYLRGLGSQLTYGQARLTGSVYQGLGTSGKYVLAVQGVLGATCCTSLDSIPKDHRLYAGGGSSVRGFAYQMAGPLDVYGNPIGGRSLTVGSVELRAKVWDNIQLVPFLDVGTDSAKPLPTFKGNYYEGAGIGVRYLTAVGPLRLDLATPLNPRPGEDSPIQVYISLGQAF